MPDLLNVAMLFAHMCAFISSRSAALLTNHASKVRGVCWKLCKSIRRSPKTMLIQKASYFAMKLTALKPHGMLKDRMLFCTSEESLPKPTMKKKRFSIQRCMCCVGSPRSHVFARLRQTHFMSSSIRTRHSRSLYCQWHKENQCSAICIGIEGQLAKKGPTWHKISSSCT